ncbi:MAG: hypothetical protein GXP04_06515 [Alphaproteobacteria bacterium]|nr:hypothetical protein [Alphaproteobacteria bacterium]
MLGEKRNILHMVQCAFCAWMLGVSWGAPGPAWAGGEDYDIGVAFGVDSVSVFRGQKSSSLNPSVSAIVTVERGDFFGGMFVTPSKIAGEVRPFVLGYVGYGSSIGEFDWNVGGRYYSFPDSSDFVIDLDKDGIPENVGRKGFYEGLVGASIPIGEATLSANVFYSPNVFGETGGAVYISGGLKIPIGAEFDLRGTIGFSEFANDLFNEDYMDYAIGIHREFIGLDMFLRYSDTLGFPGVDDRVLVFGVEKSWTLASSDKDRDRRNRKIHNNMAIDKSQIHGVGRH